MAAGLEDVRMPMPEERRTEARPGRLRPPRRLRVRRRRHRLPVDKEGWEFYYLICTDGSKGSEDPA